ncbi:MAG: alpha/beta fold hydrolase [Actinomycetota bacterium]|jgi:dipeptidyl aminopeptidase/acylaminoacyl peptidase|nr:alpha/beta fold hydrolase [Rubrobacter sp.]MDQ3507346.1 alpha/beta fold hydrolase [Actinomycetota bacterium]
MSRHLPPRRLVLGAIGATGAALVVAASRHAAKRFITPDPVETRFLTPWELGIEYEDMVFQTEDGLEISGWWLPNPEARRTIITLAGHNAARHHVLGISSALHRAGANVLLFDNRGRGTSEGDKISLGHYERLDAEAAADYVVRRTPNLPLGMMGFSMGGAVAIMAAARDERIKAVVADSAFASQSRLITYHLRQYVGRFFAPAIFRLAKGALHYDIHEVEPGKDAAKISPRPVMFIHGELDTVTDPDDSIAMYKAAGEPKELWIVEGAGHVDAYFQDRGEYSWRVAEFFEKHLGR